MALYCHEFSLLGSDVTNETSAFYEAQTLTAVFMVGNGANDETPETLSVIQFREMAKFVDDDVIGNICREKYDFVIEIYVAFR